MNQIELEIRHALNDLADEGLPVPLGRRALAGVRRRRRQRAATLTTAAALVLATVVTPHLLRVDRPDIPPSTDLTDRNLVAAYLTSTDVRVLNPATGRYRATDLLVETVSADLRTAAGSKLSSYLERFPPTDPHLGLLDTRTGKQRWLALPAPVRHPVWSPDGRYIVAPLDEDEPTRAVLVEPGVDRTGTIPLPVPDGHLLVKLCWSDARQLLAVTAARPGTAGSPEQELVVMDRSGLLVRTVPVPSSWTVLCAGRGGRVLATRLVPNQQNLAVVPPEVTVIDLRSGVVGSPVRLPWAGVIEPLAWRSNHSFVATSAYQLLVVDLELGRVRQFPDALPGDRDTYPAAPSTLVVVPGDDLTGPFPDAVAGASF